ncbi:hypothetical protein AJ88_05910 [Mesorhizobium amorphae CCBAU 01583]|nr:hypothetical protein AJ88_05910 [Mesorhizobium amorphae CCBAU 01583]
MIAPAAYGGTALLRALAAFPGFVPAVLSRQPIQTVSVADVAEAVSRAVGGSLPPRLAIDLVEGKARSLADVLSAFRAWLGLPQARVVPMPAIIGRLAGAGADVLGKLGWRSPLRSSALAALADGVTGNAQSWNDFATIRCSRWKRRWPTCPRMFRSDGSPGSGWQSRSSLPACPCSGLSRALSA